MFTTEQMNAAFTANLMCVSEGAPLPVMVITEAPPNFWLGGSLADTGWLCLPEQHRKYSSLPIRLRFDFIEQTDDRTHFRVSCASNFNTYLGTTLDTSRNGFLGLYESAREEAFWKTEDVGLYTGFGDERPAFKLRTHEGLQVRYKTENGIRYLIAGTDTSPLLFTLANFKAV